MQLVNKQDDFTLALFDFLQNAFQTFLKLAAVFCTCHQSAHIQAEHLAVFQVFRHVTAHNTLCQTFGNGCFTNARLTNQHRVVFCFSGQNANHISDFGIAPDHGVQLLRFCQRHQVLAVFIQNVIGGFGVVACHALIAAHFRKRLQKAVFVHTKGFQHFFYGTAGTFQHAEYKVLHRNVLVFHSGGGLFGSGQGAVKFARNINFVRVTSRTGHTRQFADFLCKSRLRIARLNAHFLEQLADKTVFLRQQSTEQMFLRQRLVFIFNRKRLRRLQSFQRFLCHFLCVHAITLLF